MDMGRRCWVSNIEIYSKKKKLLSKYPNCLSSIKNSAKVMERWHLAIKEANNLVYILNRRIRIFQFSEKWNLESNTLLDSSQKKLLKLDKPKTILKHKSSVSDEKNMVFPDCFVTLTRSGPLDLILDLMKIANRQLKK